MLECNGKTLIVERVSGYFTGHEGTWNMFKQEERRDRKRIDAKTFTDSCKLKCK